MLTCDFLLLDYVYVDSADVENNYIVPGLALFCLLNEMDTETTRPHHTHQFRYIGDLELGLVPGDWYRFAVRPSLPSATKIFKVLCGLEIFSGF